MKKLIGLAGLVVTFGSSHTLQAEIINGVEYADGEKSAVENAAETITPRVVVAPPAGAVVINFDDVDAPCSFSSMAGPLSDEYQTEGVTFSGPSATDGPARAHECGDWGVTGHSSPNFMVTNVNGNYSGGGRPLGPITMTFSPDVFSVQINASVGAYAQGDITMRCYNGDSLVGEDAIANQTTLQTLAVSGAGIDRCVLSSGEGVALFDDLAFGGAPSTGPTAALPVPALPLWALWVLGGLAGLFGARKLRKAV